MAMVRNFKVVGFPLKTQYATNRHIVRLSSKQLNAYIKLNYTDG
jgi:hypothetical protein